MKQYHFPQIDSTNDFAKELLKTEKEVIVTADFQTKGRGRSSRVWLGDYGNNIYFSYGINHNYIPVLDNIILYQIVGCLAVKSLLVVETKMDIFKLKYPNDVLAIDKTKNFKKISGILAEHSFSGNECTSTIIGIGINVNQKTFMTNELQNNATSLNLLGFDCKIENLIDKLTDQLKYWLNKDSKSIFNVWKEELNIIGKIVKIVGSEDNWQIDSILDDGRLLAINISTKEQKKIDNGDSVRYKFD